MISRICQSLKSQKGAVFGMDARVALIIASIMAAAGGVTVISRVERSKQESTERTLDLMVNALETHYINTGVSAITPDLATLHNAGFLTDANYQSDPWGNDWVYQFTSTQMQFEDVPVTVWAGIILSRGKDGLVNSSNVTNYSQWQTWAPQGDDIAIKFSTIEIETRRVEDYRKRGQDISTRLAALEAAWYLDAERACTTAPIPTWCTYGGATLEVFNYYPRASSDILPNVIYFDEVCESANVASNSACKDYNFTAGNAASMRQFMQLLNLPEEYAQDPWGRTLHYNSNVTARENPPFSAQVWYQ